MYSTARAALAALLLVSLSVAGCSDDSAEPRADVTAGAGTEDLVLHGHVERDGKPVDDAEVVIQLTPERELAEAEDGESIPLWVAAKTRTDGVGSFALRVAADEIKTKYFIGPDRDGLNFQVMVIADADMTQWYSTVVAVGDPAVWRSDESASVADSAVRFDFDLGKERLVITDSFDQEEKSELSVGPSQGMTFY